MSVISGGLTAYFGSKAAGDAAKAQASSSKAALKLQEDMFDVTREDMMPFLKAEQARLPYTQAALEEYDRLRQEGPGNFEDSDFYKTSLANIDISSEALAKAGAASGVGGGALSKSLLRYAIPETANQRSNWVNEWAATKLNPAAAQGLVGQTPYLGTVGQMGQNAIATGQGLASSALYGGEAIASGYLGRANALTSGLNQASSFPTQLGSMYAMSNLLGGGGLENVSQLSTF